MNVFRISILCAFGRMHRERFHGRGANPNRVMLVSSRKKNPNAVKS